MRAPAIGANMEYDNKKIAVLTSGGDASGMNACIRAVVRYAMSQGYTVYGVRRGYVGLIEDDIFEMKYSSVSNCVHTGGTILRTGRSKEFMNTEVMKKAVKNPYYIPESMKANAILKDMKKKREFFAVVIDEYGGLSGIVTVTDLLQCIVGDLYEDESAPSEPEIERLDSKTWKILGQAPLDEAAEALGVNLEGDFDTFAGYVLTMVQQIPDDGAVFTVENELMTVRVTSVKDRRIQKTMIRLKEEAPDAE